MHKLYRRSDSKGLKVTAIVKRNLPETDRKSGCEQFQILWMANIFKIGEYDLFCLSKIKKKSKAIP
jgi:hypothetical protein